jgi:putative membrane protein
MMWWNHGFWASGWGWPVFAVMAVAVLAGMVMMGRMMMRHGTSWPRWGTSNRGEERPEQILARRLASGEIDVEEFRRLRDALQQTSSSTADAVEPTGAGRRSPDA